MGKEKQSLFIVFEGIDGSGKSTQVKLLADYFRKKGRKVAIFSEPSDSRCGKTIKRLLKEKTSEKISHKEWVELFYLDSIYNIQKNILPALQHGEIVLEDRYFYSTLAYQLPTAKWKKYSKSFLQPDISFIFDLPASVSIKRVAKKCKEKHEKKAIFEKINVLERARKKYLLISKRFNVILIDAARSKKAILNDIKKEIEKRL